jgi:hypothetical protein
MALALPMSLHKAQSLPLDQNVPVRPMKVVVVTQNLLLEDLKVKPMKLEAPIRN